MADNTTLNTGTGGDVIATDDLTTLNGGAVTGVKVQRVKAGYGVDGTHVDVSAAFPLPGNVTDGTNIGKVSAAGEQIVSFTDLLPAAQSITAQDIVSTSVSGANNQSIVTGTPTAGSVASVAVSGDSSFSIQISGTWTGTLAFERSLDSGTTYTPIGAFSAGTSFITATVTQNGAFHGNAASATNIRVRSTATWTGTASVKLLAGAGGSTITIGNPLRLFDKVSGVEHSIKAASTAPVAADTALVVGLHPSSNAVTTAQSAVTTGNIVAATTIVGPISVVNMNLVSVTMTGTYAGVSNYFEVSSDNTTWFPIQGRVSDGSIANGFTGYSNASVAVDISLGAWTQFRVRATAWTSGSAVITIIAKAIAYDRTPSSLAVGYTAPGNPVFSFPPLLIGGTDGTNARMGVFKNAAAVAADYALAVTIHPSSAPTAAQPVTGTFFQATQPVSIAASVAVTGTFFQATQPVSLATNTPVIAAGTALIGSVKVSDGTNTATVKAASTASVAADTSVVVALSPNSPITFPTPTAFTLSSAATTNATSVKASAGTVFQIAVSNVGAAAAFVKLFNLATAPTVGTSVPVLTVPVGASGVVSIPFGELGMRFGTGIALSVTNLVADSDATAVAAAQVKVMVSYL